MLQRYVPDTPFLVFGMGPRRKLLDRQGALLDAPTGDVVRGWEIASERIVLDRYSVFLETAQGAVGIVGNKRDR